jgi:DNA-binding transcriptional ArsR family regulator
MFVEHNTMACIPAAITVFSSPDISAATYRISNPAQAVMLASLLDGRALPASELAYAASLDTQDAQFHLEKLMVRGLIAIEAAGRHRYYRLASTDVAQALEYLRATEPGRSLRRKALSPKARELQFCRRCYDHLAGRVGVALTHALQTHAYLVAASDKRFEVTAAGAQWFDSIGVDIGTLARSRHGLARQCLDWTERSHHLAGPLGVQLMSALCAQGWLQRMEGSRGVELMPQGRDELQRQLGVNLDSLTVSLAL